MNQSQEVIQNSIPRDIALKIVSSLQVRDVCSLGSCSRFWRELCGSDSVWESLYRDRWPTRVPQIKPALMGWRECYIDKHKEMDRIATDVVQQFSCTESIDVGQYLSAIKGMCFMELGFGDVQMFFFKPKFSVLINLIGLHYCISWLGVPIVHIWEALDSCKISQREVCVRWWNHSRRLLCLRYLGFSFSDVLLGRYCLGQ
ncbi:uncharacterized protein LOC131323254 isoform X3 [Rhododendron vialii]|uniref:uncharacterized protein LOC131323254 isoform X3 n=1 Tax=Rhododendron vialii TaxID=182163 RepID=UPI00265D6B70|nr:uncharacterized protein LOC131323254 isoform X3 [Rhododendron vialii]